MSYTHDDLIDAGIVPSATEEDDPQHLHEGIAALAAERDATRAEVEHLRGELARAKAGRGPIADAIRQSYCATLTTWFGLMSERHHERHANALLARAKDPYRRVLIDIRKSNLLARMLYGGQPLRTEKCPVHDGKWSGIRWDSDNDRPAQCPHRCGSDAEGRNSEFTGWIAVTEASDG